LDFFPFAADSAREIAVRSQFEKPKLKQARNPAASLKSTSETDFSIVDNRDAARRQQRIQLVTSGDHRFARQVTQLARAKPLLANERDLLKDTEKVALGQERTKDKNLLDTTYDKVSSNLLLDINMQYEEHLQREVEHSGYFTKTLKDVVDVIHGTGEIESLGGKSGEETSKSDRIKNAMAALKKTAGNEALTTSKLADSGYNVQSSLVENEDPEIQRMNVGYVKLIKMLDTQAPYFGGSVEYAKGIKKSFEYWVYHLSTLTKDPDRSYGTDTDHSRLLKPMKDYRTHKGLVPLNNQRNLGTGIVEARWDELPKELREKMLTKLNYLLTRLGTQAYPEDRAARRDFWIKSGGALNLEKEVSESTAHESRRKPLHEMPAEELESLWNSMNEDQKKKFYGDVVQVPWSDSHLHGGHGWEQSQRHSYLREDPEFHKLPFKQGVGLENVVGVSGNILETPERAGAKYEKELGVLAGRFGNKHTVPKSAFSGDASDVKSAYRHVFAISELVDNFVAKHQDWFQQTKQAFKPIVGGISGHTLGYLNLYSDAQFQYPDFNPDWPSMESLRTAMLGALIGDKRHHSYDEVMAASDGMPYRTSYGQRNLHYFFRTTYGDVLESFESETRGVAKKAQTRTKSEAVMMASRENTVANTILILVAYDRTIYDLMMEIIEKHCVEFGLPDYNKLAELDRKVKEKISGQ
jgi:hypothetical protein